MTNIFKTQVMESENVKPDLCLKKEIEETSDFDFSDVNSTSEQNSVNVKFETARIKIENEFMGDLEDPLFKRNFSSSFVEQSANEDLCKFEQTEHELSCSQFDQESTSLENAEEISENIKQFKCKECDHSSSRKDNLSRHIRAVHVNEKRFLCSECDYSCFEKRSLSNHIRTAHKSEPFRCSECDYTCCQKSTLLIHIQEFHSKDKPFMCSECYYLFAKKNNLRRHIRAVHSKEKTFICRECDYRCFRNWNLSNHIRAVHNQEKLFNCSDCDYSSSRKGSVSRHISAVHISKEKNTALTLGM